MAKPSIPPPSMALPAQVWTMGWRVPRAARGLGVEVVVWHTVPPLDGLLCCARCPHHGGPRLCCGVERAGRALVRCCRLLCARAPCCAASVPGRRRPAHICAQSLSMLWVCGMEQGWAILQSCGRKTNTLARKRVEVSWVEISTCQGNKHRLTGKTSEAVFVSFVWVN